MVYTLFLFSSVICKEIFNSLTDRRLSVCSSFRQQITLVNAVINFVQRHRTIQNNGMLFVHRPTRVITPMVYQAFKYFGFPRRSIIVTPSSDVMPNFRRDTASNVPYHFLLSFRRHTALSGSFAHRYSNPSPYFAG